MSKILSIAFKTSAALVVTLSFLFTVSPPYLYTASAPVRHEVFNLDTAVSDKSVSGLVYLLETATPSDDITIYINSPGGSVEAGMIVLRDMQNSKANHIEAVVTGMAASMAEGIAMEADHITMKPGSQLMFHYGDAAGKVLTEADKHNPDLAISDYMLLMDGFMHLQDDTIVNKQGWDVIHKGGEYWVTDVQFKDRGGDSFDGRKIQNVYISQIINLIDGFGERALTFTMEDTGL